MNIGKAYRRAQLLGRATSILLYSEKQNVVCETLMPLMAKSHVQGHNTSGPGALVENMIIDTQKGRPDYISIGCASFNEVRKSVLLYRRYKTSVEITKS